MVRAWSRRAVLLCCGAGLAACEPRVALDRAGAARLGTIGVVTPAVAATPAAPTNLPLIMPFGSIGRFVDAALERERDRRLTEALRAWGYRAAERWTLHLTLALMEAGYRPVEVPSARFDLDFLARYPPVAVDAVLDTVVSEYGFVANLPEGPFVPFAAVSVRLADPRGRVLFQDRFVMNALRPFDAIPVAGPSEPRLAGEGQFAADVDGAVEGVDAALSMMAAQVAARLR
jgi:hypothetical protein